MFWMSSDVRSIKPIVPTGEQTTRDDRQTRGLDARKRLTGTLAAAMFINSAFDALIVVRLQSMGKSTK
jgi:hypothetical protein